MEMSPSNMSCSGRPHAHQRGDAIFQINTAEKETVFRRTLNSVAERPDAARNDRSLLHRIDARQGGRYQRVALMSSICHAAYRASITLVRKAPSR